MASSAMLAFGLGTLPAVLAAGFAAQQLTRVLQQRQIRWGLAIIVIVFGGWTIFGGAGHVHNHHHQPNQLLEGVEQSVMDHSQMDHSQMDHSNMNHEAMVDPEKAPAAGAGTERQRTEVDMKSVDNQNSSAKGQTSGENTASAVPMNHHEN
jgi:uncharacterized protein